MALTPMMQFYLNLKEKNKDAILFFRLGDFYEMFFEDAETASRVLGITLTGRDCGLEKKAPMCGVPFHSADTYISRLLDAGFKVAICEQLSEPKKGELVDRDIVRIITPGTVMEEDILTPNNNFILSVYTDNIQNVGVSWLDLSTGEFNMTAYSGENAWTQFNDLLNRVRPSEIISCDEAFRESESLPSVRTGTVPKFYKFLDYAYELNNATKIVLNQLKIGSIAVLDCNGKENGIRASGALLEYISQTQKRKLEHINRLNIERDNTYLYIDASAKINLELNETIFERNKTGTLAWVLDKTGTSMGKRLLLSWLEKPLRSEAEINARLDAVEELINNNVSRDELNNVLRTVNDVERLCGRLSYGSIGPRGCREIGNTIKKLPKIKNILNNFNSSLLKQCNAKISDLSELSNLLDNAFIDDDNIPILARDGGFIKSGFSKELDEQKLAMSNGQQWIAELEAKEKELTDIKQLRIRYNNVIGYFFEIPLSQKDKIPFRFERRQTLANNERYTSPDLQKLSEMILGAEEKVLELEQELFTQIKEKMKTYLISLQISSQQLAILDTLISFAKISIENRYNRPTINNNIKYLQIEGGRHPVVEKINKNQRFIPNDTVFNETCRTMIITGPNMAGKSTYMRQIALITIMAHLGCFVPASKAEIPICDRIFTRIGASDNLGLGQSTFMVEMIEVANILQNATEKSLLILDEIGRGTSTYDGLSIAWSVLEYITKNIKAFTLFATHYHEITELEGKLDNVKNYQVAVKEYDNSVIFLHNILAGSANRSFGIEVAHLAGICDDVVNRAKEILHSHEEVEFNTSPLVINKNNNVKTQNNNYNEIINELKNIEPNILTPLEAIAKLAELKDKLKE